MHEVNMEVGVIILLKFSRLDIFAGNANIRDSELLNESFKYLFIFRISWFS